MIDLTSALQDLEKLRQKLVMIFPGYITHIRFPRYKNLMNDAVIEFSFPISALVGPNGSGKTSVLNALYGAPIRYSTGEYWFSTEVDPIVEGDGSPHRFIYGHYNSTVGQVVETRKARVRKVRNERADPNYWEPTKETVGDGMMPYLVPAGVKKKKEVPGRSLDRWTPVSRDVLYINFRKELSAFDKYFYFGKDPSVKFGRDVAAAKKAGKAAPARRIINKMERVRQDAKLLARVIEAGDKSVEYRNVKIAIENRLLRKDELEMVSFVLGREYEEARWIRHRLFQGDGGLSILFKTKYGRYSEAFAGSGEVAVTSCVVQVLGAKSGTLLLLDEPEVSLHPGAQERLLAFLALMVKRKKLQVIFSTHSPHIIAALPDDAIKTFYQTLDGLFGIIQSTHPYAAFRRLGDTRGKEVQIVVEDPLAQAVVQQAITLIEDEAVRSLFKVDFVQGGASSILTTRIPVLMEREGTLLVLLDGDQSQGKEIQDPDTIPSADDSTLEQTILEQIGIKPQTLIDGGAGGGNKAKKAQFYRRYMKWTRCNLRYIPTSCPEELVLRAAGHVTDVESKPSQVYKERLYDMATQVYGHPPKNDEIDAFGKVLIGQNREKSTHLIEIKTLLENFLHSIKAS